MSARHPWDAEFTKLAKEAAEKRQRPVQLEPMQAPFAGDRYEDQAGVQWRRRKGELDPKRFLRLLNDASVIVVHQYLWDPIREVDPGDRQRFWTNALAKMAASRSSDFMGSEYVNDAHQHLLFISESC
jgi:hypothetical protein